MWLELMQTFHLEEQVAAFVTAQVRELVADRHDFDFAGGNRTRFCDLKGPHPPHVLGTYDTVRHGRLEEFCLGRSGELPGQGTLRIVVTRQRAGSAEYPTIAEGYWFIEPVEEV